MQKKKPQPKLIHIHAKCEMFEVFEIVEEDKSVGISMGIKKTFEHMNGKKGNAYNLSVKTRLINPTLL